MADGYGLANFGNSFVQGSQSRYKEDVAAEEIKNRQDYIRRLQEMDQIRLQSEQRKMDNDNRNAFLNMLKTADPRQIAALLQSGQVPEGLQGYAVQTLFDRAGGEQAKMDVGQGVTPEKLTQYQQYIPQLMQDPAYAKMLSEYHENSGLGTTAGALQGISDPAERQNKLYEMAQKNPGSAKSILERFSSRLPSPELETKAQSQQAIGALLSNYSKLSPETFTSAFVALGGDIPQLEPLRKAVDPDSFAALEAKIAGAKAKQVRVDTAAAGLETIPNAPLGRNGQPLNVRELEGMDTREKSLNSTLGQYYGQAEAGFDTGVRQGVQNIRQAEALGGETPSELANRNVNMQLNQSTMRLNEEKVALTKALTALQSGKESIAAISEAIRFMPDTLKNSLGIVSSEQILKGVDQQQATRLRSQMMEILLGTTNLINTRIKEQNSPTGAPAPGRAPAPTPAPFGNPVLPMPGNGPAAVPGMGINPNPQVVPPTSNLGSGGAPSGFVLDPKEVRRRQQGVR